MRATARRGIRAVLAIGGLAGCLSAPRALPVGTPDIVDKRKTLESMSFLDNRDWEWYRRNIPFFESPDPEIDATYYYRWELITKHLVYGSPATGYTYTEFMDRPGWSGTYGAISCAAGHHLYETRWLKDRRIAQDYARYWFDTPGAQPRRYSAWLADAVWATFDVQGDRAFALSMRKGLAENYHGWEREHFDPKVGMFWQTGMADGMETNINSRQTKDWFAGAEGYRPTLNSYMYADALALSNIASLAGDSANAAKWRASAGSLKKLVQDRLWDPRRQFFLHMFRNDEKDGIRALSRTYETGKYAGNPHGREEIGFVPWEFNLPDAGFEAAWKYLMDPAYFYAQYGPTTAERNDPLFLISKNCCVWSGQSWPYATTQTLKGMANLLQNYRQSYVNRDDYFKLLKVYTRTQRKNGRPYIAESANPDTGSWEGSDSYDHSENYFHSGYNDLIITGLVGLKPRPDDVVEVDPLAPKSWDYFALDDVSYHGHRLAVVWDRTGARYGRGKGLLLLVDGRRIASAPDLRKLSGRLPGAKPLAPQLRLINFAVNNDGTFYPRVTASHTFEKTPLNKLNDGQYWYTLSPPNRWSARGSGNPQDWCAVDFGIARPIRMVRLYVLDDGPGSGIEAPQKLELQYEQEGWKPVPSAKTDFGTPVGHRPNTFSFPELRTRKLRVFITHKPGTSSGLSELEAWGDAPLPLPTPNAPIGNLAFNPTGKGYPEATASYTSRFDRVEEVNDGKSFFSTNSRNRWTAYESPNPADWVQIDFGAEKEINTVVLHLWGDGGGVRAPAAYSVQVWDGGAWVSVSDEKRSPEKPNAGATNTVTFRRVKTSKVRVVFTHAKPGFAGMTEMEVWNLDPSAQQ